MKHENDTAPLSATAREGGHESIPDLIRHLAMDISTLLAKEIQLAKSEARQSINEAKAAVGAIATGVAISMAGLVILLMSAVYGLSNIMEPWLAALIVGAAALLIGIVMVSAAKKKISSDAMIPHRTLESAHKDKETLKRATR